MVLQVWYAAHYAEHVGVKTHQVSEADQEGKWTVWGVSSGLCEVYRVYCVKCIKCIIWSVSSVLCEVYQSTQGTLQPGQGQESEWEFNSVW